ncbi:MAG: cell envelope integrity EipB family protein [Hyphomicrobiaceae bacterium]|nr:cell envelope integrity EipB family protein [Hyphomicrobiaceae bacterium]
MRLNTIASNETGKVWLVMAGTVTKASVGLALAVGATFATSATAATVLAPHRAVYDLKLGESRTGSGVSSIEGRMVYELTGSACEGYTQNMRFVTRMSTQQGSTTVSDLRSSTWEDAVAAKFKFNTSTIRDNKPAEHTAGDASRAASGAEVKVDLTKPVKKSQALKGQTAFPVQHSIAVLEAAKAGTTKLRLDLYDGSEQGDKVYDTVSSIGKAIPKGGNQKLPVVKGAETLDQIPAWPISISYFELGKEKEDSVPVYELSFVFFENGVSRKLAIDYGEFVIQGDLKEIKFLDVQPCTPGQAR